MTNKGIEMLKEFEGLRLKAYKPVATEQYFTVGYGHYGSDVTEGLEITKERAEELLREDIAKFERSVIPLLPVTLHPLSVDALVSLAYNIGTASFAKSTLLKVIKADKNNLLEIEKQFNKWVYAGKTVLKGLQKRRADEYSLYEEGVLAQYSKKECYELGKNA